MSVSSLSAASALDATQSPLLSLGQTKRRKHPSMSERAPPANPPAVAGQPGSKVNVTA